MLFSNLQAEPVKMTRPEPTDLAMKLEIIVTLDFSFMIMFAFLFSTISFFSQKTTDSVWK